MVSDDTSVSLRLMTHDGNTAHRVNGQDRPNTLNNTAQKRLYSDAFAGGKLTKVVKAAEMPACVDDDSSCSLHKENNTSTTIQCSVCSPIPLPPLGCRARGSQKVYGWWRKRATGGVLGHMKGCMESLAEHCLASVHVVPQRPTTLRVLSLSDGCINDSKIVPSSVLLAGAFTSLDKSKFPGDLKRIQIFGADVENPRIERLVPLKQASWVPSWVELQHLRLDNQTHFGPQIDEFFVGSSHLESPKKFDIILMRQGLCYCKDHSFDCRPPEKLEITGVKWESHECDPGASGTYILEPDFRNGRPIYKNGSRFVLRWRAHPGYDWIIEENGTRDVWAKVCVDCGNPAVAQASWYAWDGKEYVKDDGISCKVACEWSSYQKPPPHGCKCCGGIPLDAEAIESFMGRVAAVLDERQPNAFAFLHSGHYQGQQEEVEEFHLELERAACRFNSAKHASFVATVLRKEENCDETTPYWQRIDGLLLSPRPRLPEPRAPRADQQPIHNAQGARAARHVVQPDVATIQLAKTAA